MVEETFFQKLIKYYPLFVLILILVMISIYTLYQLFIPVYLPPPGKEIYIPPKSSLKEIGNLLEKEGILRSSFYLRIYLAFKKHAHRIKPGYYKFEGKLTIPKLSEMLVKGGKGIVITFPEGLTMLEIQDLLNKKGINVDFTKYTLKDFKNLEIAKYFPENVQLEGFLAPDTYEFFKEETEREIIEKFLKNFSNKFLPEFIKKNGSKLPEYFYQKLILASILEKEVKKFDEMKIVAGILEKRISLKKKLEVDATVAYPKCKKFPCDWNVTSEELKKESPYNTYLKEGYPPTPICNPGLNSIKASLEPQSSEFLYYLTNKDGEAIFAKTLKEHERNIKKYLRGH